MRPIMVGSICVMAAICSASFADENDEHVPAAPPSSNQGNVWVLGQVDYVTTYYYRGFFQEDDGIIVQPAVKFGIDLYRGEGPIDRVSFVVGDRASLHENKTFSNGIGPEQWYENDFVIGAQLQAFDRLHLESLYVAISSPNGAFGTIQEANFNFRIDDKGVWPGDFAIEPFANLKVETDGSAAAGNEGVVLELGVEPGFTLIPSRSFPVRISFPTLFSLSVDEYYALAAFPPIGFPGAEDETFGYARTGVLFTMPLLFVPPSYGQWAVTAGVEFMFLGDNLQLFHPDNNDTDVIGRVGVLFRY